MAAERRWSIAPYFFADDVVATANYYRDKLGFRYDRFWNDPPTFCIVHRDGVFIMLAEGASAGQPNRSADPEGGAWDAYVWVDDADALHDEYAARGVRIVRAPCDQPYNIRDFEIEDCNGYRLCFGHDTGGKG
jgi:catechol 2,3-dioxygenase-like lactoylglutathione lyase family enzyme